MVGCNRNLLGMGGGWGKNLVGRLVYWRELFFLGGGGEAEQIFG